MDCNAAKVFVPTDVIPMDVGGKYGNRQRRQMIGNAFDVWNAETGID